MKIAGLLAFLFLCKLTFADENTVLFDSANSSYSAGNYEKAIKQYESLISNNAVSAEVYYNLGNAYFKTDELGLAILNYERAKKLDPDSEDLRINLKIANQKTEDKIDKAPELFLTSWKNSITTIFSEKGWSVFCILTFIASLALIALYILSQSRALKKTGFYGGIILLLVAFVSFFLAGHRQELSKEGREAVITGSTATITSAPNEKGTKLFILHEGTKVSVSQDLDGWMEIEIANGNAGWIKSELLQKI